MTAIFGVTGWKNSGKTTLVTRLIAEFARRGYRVNSIKHAHHAFDIDVPGTDSFRHREAGATEVAIVSGTRWALMHEVRPENPGDDEPTMDEIIARLSPADLILVEGYKREGHPKIECRLAADAGKPPLADNDPMIVAVASDGETETGALPRFDLDAIAEIADFIVAYHALPEPKADAAAQTA